MATDLAVTVEDKPGALAGMGEAIGAAGINIGGVCGAATPGASVVHLLVDDAAGARQALEGAGFSSIEEREVAVVDVEDRPGVLGEVARKLADAGVNVGFAYATFGGTNVVFGVGDLEEAQAAL